VVNPRKLLRNGSLIKEDVVSDIAKHLQNVNIERSYDESKRLIEAIFDRIVYVVMEEERPVSITGIGTFYPRRNKNGAIGMSLEHVTSESLPSITFSFKRAKQGIKTKNMRTKKIITGEE
jgi:nucleoid DNA-binding protein